jgi:HEAT repeat protein
LGSPLPRDRFEQVHDIRKELVLHQGFIEFLLHSIPADRERVSESRYWLRRLKDPQLREEFLREWLGNHKDELRLRAAALGAEFPPERRVSMLYKLAMGDTADRVRERALTVLMDIEGAESLRERLELDSIHGELRIRKPALQALHVFQDERNREFILKQALNPDHSESLRAVAVDTLAALDLPAAVDDLRDMTMQNQDPRVRQRATQALLNLQSKEAYEQLFTGIRNTPSIVVDDSPRPGLVGMLGVVLKIALVGVLLIANTVINGLLLLAGGRYVLGVAIIVAEGFGIWMMEESESLEVIGGIVFALTLALGYILPLGTLLKARSTFKLRSYSFRGILCVILFFVNVLVFFLVHGLAHLLLGRVGRALALFAAEVAALGAFAMVNYLDPIFYIPGASDLTDAVTNAYLIAGATLFFSSFALDWGVVAVRHVIFFRRVEGKRRRNALLRAVLATPLAAETVTDWAQGPESTNQRWARSVLLEHAEQVPHEELVNLLENDNPETQKFAIKSLARSKNEELVKELADRWKLARPELSHAIRKIMSIKPTEASVNAFREWTRAQGLQEKIRYRMIRARFRIAYWPKSLMVVASLGLPLLMLVTYHAILSYQTEASPLVTFIVRNEDAGIELRVTVANFVADKYPEADMTPVRLIDDFTSGFAALFGWESDSDRSDAQDKDDQPRSAFHELLNIQDTTESCYVRIGLVQSLGIAVSRLEERYADTREIEAPSQRWTPGEKQKMFEKPLKVIETQLRTEGCRPDERENPHLFDGVTSVEDQVTKKALLALNTTVKEVPEAFSDNSSHVRSLTDALQTKLDKWGALTALAGIYVLSDKTVIEWDKIIESDQQDDFVDELETARQRLMQDKNRGADLDIDRIQTRAVTGFNTLAASLLEHAQVIKDEDSERKALLKAQANEFLDHAKSVSGTLVDGEAQSTVRTRKARRRSLR